MEPKKYFIEHWKSDQDNREDHFFINDTRKIYLFGMNPDIITPEYYTMILAIIQQAIENVDLEKIKFEEKK